MRPNAPLPQGEGLGGEGFLINPTRHFPAIYSIIDTIKKP